LFLTNMKQLRQQRKWDTIKIIFVIQIKALIGT
jgi:hypothetical protein